MKPNIVQLWNKEIILNEKLVGLYAEMTGDSLDDIACLHFAQSMDGTPDMSAEELASRIEEGIRFELGLQAKAPEISAQAQGKGLFSC